MSLMSSNPPNRLPLYKSMAAAALMFLTSMALCSCTQAPPKIVAKYPTLPAKKVPAYLADTILQYTDMSGTEPYPVSGYGLVANLNGTGGSRAPTAVRSYIIKDINRHNSGTHVLTDQSPEDLLNNKSFAIVRVDGEIPPGARAGNDWWTWFDVRVSAIPESDTTSLSHGDLYRTDLKVGGADPLDPGGGQVAVMAQATGPVFVNPAHVFDTATDPSARADRRTGVILGGARPLADRPLVLRLRAPERRMARAIEHRIIEQFQDVVDDDLKVKQVANAQDEGMIYVYVPKAYSSDWNHFVGVLNHLYMRGGAPEYAALKAQQLAKIALTPDAPLQDITYAWEGLGKPALPAIVPLMSNPHHDVQYAAVRAAAFIGDPDAIPALLDIARTPGNDFRIPAVQALGQLPATPMVDSLLRPLLDSDEALVRIEAYKVLARHAGLENPEGGPIYSHVVKSGNNEKFVVDIIHGTGSPLIYASRQGIPRLAIFGSETRLNLPAMFMAMSDRLSISSDDNGAITIFYRGPELEKPVKENSSPDLAEIASRLGGDSSPGMQHLDFSYSDVVAVLQALVNQQKVSGLSGQQRQPAAFVLQEAPAVQAEIDGAPLIRDDGARPQTDKAAPAVDLSVGSNVIGLNSNSVK